MTTATRVVLVIAIIAMIENRVLMSPVSSGRIPASTTSSSAASELASVSVETVSAAAIETST